MRYMWPHQVEESVAMQVGTVSDDFVVRTEYNLKMMENLQRSTSKKVKRFRSAFTTDQVNYLEKQFKKFPYIGNAHRKEVAIALNIPERAVKIWFQNRRMKEKKETTTKELDDDQNIRKPVELAKDQLINVNKPSANDQQYSLPLLTDVNRPNCDKILTSNPSCNLSTGLLIKDSGFKAQEIETPRNGVNTPPIFNKPHLSISPTSYSKSAEFSIDLCKKYKNELSNSSVMKPIPSEYEDIKPVEHKPLNYKVMEQMVPEDLSASRKISVPTDNQAQIPNVATSNPGYISVVPTVSPFYAQPYYTPGGVLWKPLNVVSPVSAPDSSLPVSDGLGNVPIVQDLAPKKCCSCDCHVKPLMPYSVQQQPSNPQYIITAVQFPNSSATKF